MEQNQYALIDVKKIKRERWRKILIFCALLVVVVSISSTSGVLVAKRAREKEEAEQEEIGEVVVIEEDNLRVPIYSEEAKERIKHIYVSNDTEKIAFLTFDDGPSANVTPQILDVLRQEEVKATFFVLGSRVELYPELLKQEYEEGHYIANHGYSHVYTSIYASPESVLEEYAMTEIRIKEALGESYTSHLFRFPGGSEGGKYAKVKNQAKILLEENHIAHINWNALNNDSVGKPTKESLVRDLKQTTKGKNKIVILMHDAGTKQMTADTLPEIIHYLKEEGYSFQNFYDIMY